MRRTKIVVTLGPKSWHVIEDMVDSGVDVFRLNLSHVRSEEDYLYLTEVARKIRKVAEEKGKAVQIMVDCPGHKLRLGEFIERQVNVGDTVCITTDPQPVNNHIPFPYKRFLSLMEVGQEVLVGDGSPRFVVTAKPSTDLAICEVTVPEVLKPRKGLTVRGLRVSDLRLSSYTKKDERGMRFAAEIGADQVVISYATQARQALAFKKYYQRVGGAGLVTFKYELAEAGEDLKAIVEATDIGYVGQGDLGLSLPHEKIPGEGAKVIRAYGNFGKDCYVGTELLLSMEERPFPGRGEVAGIFWLVYQGASGLVTSGETSTGKYPVVTVKALDKAIREAEALMG